MAKPVLKRRGAVGKPSTKKQELTPELLARNAVEAFEGEHILLTDMRDDFEVTYSDAASALRTIKEQEDIVSSKIADAKALVAQAGMTIGGFICQIKHSKPRYNDESFTELAGKNGDGALVTELIKAGAIKKISLAPSATKWFAQHPQAAENYKEAWRDSQELSPAITTPKL